MSKAEERALEKYPLLVDDDKEGLEALKYIRMECECASVFNEAQEAKQVYFIEGYHQAEKDLALTWRDMELIYHLSDEIPYMEHDDFFKELLKRYKEKKENEVVVV